MAKRDRRHLEPLTTETVLDAWGTRGAASGQMRGESVLVWGGIPGEQVSVTVARGRRPHKGTVTQVLQPSPDRVVPPCPYFLQGCGGCQWQHVRYRTQLLTKREMVDAEMARAGVHARVQDAHAMDSPWRYRHTAALALGWEAGFRPRGRRGIIEVHDCLISHPLIGRLAHALNRALRSGEIPNYRGRVWAECTVIGLENCRSIQVCLQGITGLTLEEHPELPEVAVAIKALPGVSSVAFRRRDGLPESLIGQLVAPVEVGGCTLFLPAGSFFQTNFFMLARLLGRMRQILGDRSLPRAADVYGGVGTFALNLARSVGAMSLIELDSQAAEAARRGAAEAGLANVTVTAAHAERALPGAPPYDLIVVDPPRSGLGPEVSAAIIANGAPLVLYVSCAPPSLASDLALLQDGGYNVRSLEIFDFYPQTYHVESLAVLERA